MRSKLDLFSINEKTSPLVHIIHSYDYNGNRTKRYDPIHAANSELYTYDNLGQIKTLNRGVLNTAQDTVTVVNHSESWNFDKTGNWSQYTKNGNTENRTHNATNELQGIANHDANGNMVLMSGLKGKYDAWNRLVEVRDSDDNLISSYEYNGLNQRIKKTVNNVETKSFFNENWQEVESVTNNQVTSYVWGLKYIDDLVLREKGEERLYSLADPNWNVIAICNTSGNIQERYTYDAFGKRNVFDADFTAKTETEFNWNRAFTGQLLDIETGLILYRRRLYNTRLGRFVTRDPVGYRGGDINLLRYTFNRSSTVLDPLGLLCECGEELTIILSVGPLNAWKAQPLVDKAHAAAAKVASKLGCNGNVHNNACDAFRHCYWMCITALKIGQDNAEKIGNIHEECDKEQPEEEASMDLHNNQIGRDLSKSCKTENDCEDACLKEAGPGGSLQTSPSGTFPPGGAYPNPYPNFPEYPDIPTGPIFIPGPIFSPTDHPWA
jgi:RHS repeat-associated protein